MISSIGKRWQSWSKTNPIFEIRGYTKAGEDYKNDATKAVEILSKTIGQPIPDDIELVVTSTDQ